jgi:tRNA A-37 threonylcarbamoyl transferase component Bud32
MFRRKPDHSKLEIQWVNNLNQILKDSQKLDNDLQASLLKPNMTPATRWRYFVSDILTLIQNFRKQIDYDDLMAYVAVITQLQRSEKVYGRFFQIFAKIFNGLCGVDLSLPFALALSKPLPTVDPSFSIWKIIYENLKFAKTKLLATTIHQLKPLKQFQAFILLGSESMKITETPQEYLAVIGQGAVGKVTISYNKKKGVNLITKEMVLVSDDEYSIPAIQKEINLYKILNSKCPVAVPRLVNSNINPKSMTARISFNVAGFDLGRYLSLMRPTMTLMDYRLVMESAIEQLDCLHRNFIVHRDIKPGNLIINPEDYTIKYIDLGESCETKPITFGIFNQVKISQNDVMTCLSDSPGTLVYMSPELVRHKPKLTTFEQWRRSDIWSLGVTFYEIITGTIPFDGPDQFAIYRQITDKDVTLSTLGAFGKIHRIINQMLQKDPMNRPDTTALLKLIRAK